MIYGKSEPTNIYEVKALLYVQEAQMDKCHQQLTTPSATANIVNSKNNKFSAKIGTGNGNLQHQRACGHGFRGRGRGRKMNGSASRSNCQLFNKYGRVILECWHRFDEYFVPTLINLTLKKLIKVLMIKASQARQDKEQITHKSLHF